MQFVSGQSADPMLGGTATGVAQDAGPGGHAFAELIGKGRQRFLGHTKRPKSIPAERQCDPAVKALHPSLHVGRGLYPIHQLRPPRPPADGSVECQELVASGDGRRPRQQVC